MRNIQWQVGATVVLLLAGLAGIVSMAVAQDAPADADSADPAATHQRDIVRMLELAWETSPMARAEAEELFERLATGNRSSSVLHAQALVKIKQRRYADALKLIDELTALEPKNLEYARAKVWLTVLLRKAEQGLVSLQRLVTQLPKPTDPPREDEAQTRELLRFAGRVHGFLEGPGQDWINEEVLQQQRKKLVDLLDEPRRTAFLEGRDAVVDRWLEQKDDEQSTRQRVKRDQDQQRDDRLSDLDKQREQNERRAGELTNERSRLRSELNDQLADLQRQERPLVDQLARLDAQATVTRRELTLAASDSDRLEALLARERDPLLREQYRRDLARLDSLITRYQANLTALTRQGVSINTQRADIQRRAAQVQQSIGQQLDALDKEQGDVQKRTRAADGEERRLRKMNTGDSSQLRAMAAQSSAFTSYVTFPLEEQRTQLLDKLRSRRAE